MKGGEKNRRQRRKEGAEVGSTCRIIEDAALEQLDPLDHD